MCPYFIILIPLCAFAQILHILFRYRYEGIVHIGIIENRGTFTDIPSCLLLFVESLRQSDQMVNIYNLVFYIAFVKIQHEQ